MSTQANRRAVNVDASEAVEDYVKAIYSLERAKAGPVSTSSLADRLGVTPGSASAMVKKLAGMKLVRHLPYHGFVLTPLGKRLALEILRHHRLLELYLAEAFDMPWDQVHAEADALEHVLSEELEERIAVKLGNPTVDPHGDPIPTREGQVKETETLALADLGAGDRAKLVRVSDSDSAMLRYLSARGIKPGQLIEVRDKQPFGGPMFVRIGDVEQVLGGAIAQAMRVRRIG
jgi:DtxR family Mn-dependent transcriptional regulator